MSEVARTFLREEGIELMLIFGQERQGAFLEATHFMSAKVMLDMPIERRSLGQATDGLVKVVSR